MPHASRVALALAVLLLSASVLSAADIIPIAEVVADPTKYQVNQARVAGVIWEHRLKELATGGRKACVQTFRLADESGSIAVEFTLFCAEGKGQIVPFEEGDRVFVEGRIDLSQGIRILASNVGKQ